MRIVVAHNYYGSRAFGGESIVFQQEVELLRSKGYEVETLEYENAEIDNYSWKKKIFLPFSFGFSPKVYAAAVALFRRFQPQILHVHNYKYVMTPAVFQAARECGVKTVLTLHNYRLICPGGQLRRGNIVCEECLQRNPVRVLWRSQCASKYSSRWIQYAFFLETRGALLKQVDAFIALTKFAREKFIEGGVPANKIYVKPNFVFEPSSSLFKQCFNTRYAVYVGRLSEEKGIRFLLNSWKGLTCPLVVVGDGPEMDWARLHAPSNVKLLGQKSHVETINIIKQAAFLVFPSLWYEGLPMTLIESCAVGTPIIATNLGPRFETVIPGVSGILFESNNQNDFIAAVRKLEIDDNLCLKLGCGARRLYDEKYSSERNFTLLDNIYRLTLKNERHS